MRTVNVKIKRDERREVLNYLSDFGPQKFGVEWDRARAAARAATDRRTDAAWGATDELQAAIVWEVLSALGRGKPAQRAGRSEAPAP